MDHLHLISLYTNKPASQALNLSANALVVLLSADWLRPPNHPHRTVLAVATAAVTAGL